MSIHSHPRPADRASGGDPIGGERDNERRDVLLSDIADPPEGGGRRARFLAPGGFCLHLAAFIQGRMVLARNGHHRIGIGRKASSPPLGPRLLPMVEALAVDMARGTNGRGIFGLHSFGPPPRCRDVVAISASDARNHPPSRQGRSHNGPFRLREMGR